MLRTYTIVLFYFEPVSRFELEFPDYQSGVLAIDTTPAFFEPDTGFEPMSQEYKSRILPTKLIWQIFEPKKGLEPLMFVFRITSAVQSPLCHFGFFVIGDGDGDGIRTHINPVTFY